MAQCTIKPLLTPVVPEGISASAPLTLVSTPLVPLVTPRFPPLSPRAPQHPTGHWQTPATSNPITDPILVTYARVPEPPVTLLSQGYIPLNSCSAAATLAIGLQSFGQSDPLGSGPSPTLHLSIPTDGTPEEQYQYLMETALRLQGMALSVRPSFILAGPGVPVQPAPAYHAFSSTLLPRPLSQLLTVSVVGARIPPLASAQHYAQHAPPPPGSQSFGLVGA